MRPFLVVIGGLFLALAVAVLVTVYLVPPPTTTQQVVTSIAPTKIPAGGWSVLGPIVGTTSDSGSFNLRWTSSVAVTVELYPAASCSGSTVPGCTPTVLARWTAAVSGNWSHAGPLSYPLEMNVSVPGSQAASVQAMAVDTLPVAESLPPVLTILVDVVCGILIAVGGVLIFLGLFLRAGVYSGPAPLTSRSAEDAEEVARQYPDPPPP